MWKISGHWRGLEHPVRALGLFRRAKVASVCQPGPAGCRSTVWGIIDWRSQWSVPSAAQRPGPDGAFSPGPGVINVPSRWETMPQPRSSRRPPPRGHLPPLYHTQVMFPPKKNDNREKKFTKNSQRSDRTNQNYIFRGRLVWTHMQSLEEGNAPLSLAKFAETGSLPDVVY